MFLKGQTVQNETVVKDRQSKDKKIGRTVNAQINKTGYYVAQVGVWKC
jgi:hypothetical protein